MESGVPHLSGSGVIDGDDLNMLHTMVLNLLKRSLNVVHPRDLSCVPCYFLSTLMIWVMCVNIWCPFFSQMIQIYSSVEKMHQNYKMK